MRILVFLFLPFIQPASAQDFQGGMRLGLCASQVSGDHLSGFDKAGIIFGAFVKRDFSSKVALQMEMVFIQKGSRSAVSTIDNSYYRMRLHYMEVPLLFQYYAKKKLILEAGPSFGVLLFSEENDQLGVIYNTPPFNKTEFAYHAGMQFVFAENWSVDARYSASINTVRDYEGSYNYNYFDKGQRNSTIQLGLNFTF